MLSLRCAIHECFKSVLPTLAMLEWGSRMISPSARSLWGSHFAGLCSEASRSVFPTLAMLEW